MFGAMAVVGALVCGSLMGHPAWGALGGLLVLGVPDAIAWAAVFKPDHPLVALSLAAVFLLALGVERRRPELLCAAAFVIGFAVTVKLPAIGLLLPLAIAIVFLPPRRGWTREAAARVRDAAGRHRRALIVSSAVWLALVVLLNLGAAPPATHHVRDLALGLTAAGAAATVLLLALRPTRLAGVATLAVALAAAAAAGVLLPNLLYASMPVEMVRWVALALAGRGVSASSQPFSGGYGVLLPWLPLLLLALLGAWRGLRAGERSHVLWLGGAAAMGLLAALRYVELRYYAPAAALLVPLALRGLGRPGRAPSALAAAGVAAVLVVPYAWGIDGALDRGRRADRTERVNAWVEQRLRPREVALTHLESSDGRYFYVVRTYAADGPEPDYRFLTADPNAVEWVRKHGRRVRFLVLPPGVDPEGLLLRIGYPARVRAAGGPTGVFEVTRA
jgi:hypothetical protein